MARRRLWIIDPTTREYGGIPLEWQTRKRPPPDPTGGTEGGMNQPNIILIITDQQRYDTINALGYPHMDTPNLDRLANEGVSFDNCHITAPSCAPARASLFTGYYPHVTGILANGDRWRRSWVENLADAGYHCVNIGKMHSNPFETPLGFHERYVVENKDRYLEGRYYFDEWDKALAARGHVKQQRELYRQRGGLQRAHGRLQLGFAGGFAIGQFHRRFGAMVAAQPSADPAALPANRLSWSASTLRSHARSRHRIHRPRTAPAQCHASRAGRTAAAFPGTAQAQHGSRPRLHRASGSADRLAVAAPARLLPPPM